MATTRMLPADLPSPSRAAAWLRVARIQADRYAQTRNWIDGAVTGLSPYLTHGLVTLPEVVAALPELDSLAVNHKLIYEFGWREFFRHRWAHLGDGILESLHPGPLPEHAYASTLPADIREARCGVAAIDVAIRDLYATGTMHNHARMWLASYVVHLRRVHWRAGADWLLGHLLDGDLASNHLSWQWVAGTGSHKPYLFNADNVARYAPAHWHSAGSPIDQDYDALEHIARGASPVSGPSWHSLGVTEPPRITTPPPDIAVKTPDPAALAALEGRPLWLVHSWALRAPPADLPPETMVIGIYLADYHRAWPWSAARWRWVDAAMATISPRRWLLDAAQLATIVRSAASVRCVDEPHLRQWLAPPIQRDPAPRLFPPVASTCHSFSGWWRQATRGLQGARELL